MFSSTRGMQASHGRLRCPARGLRGRGWRPRAVRLPRAYPACTSRSQSGMAVLGFGERPPGALVRSVQGCSECLRACAPCPARDPRVRGRHPRPSCSSRPLAACTSGTRPGSGAPRGALGAPHGPPRCSATPARAEHVRTGTRGGALRGPETHPVTPRMLGARVVGVLGRPAGA